MVQKGRCMIQLIISDVSYLIYSSFQDIIYMLISLYISSKAMSVLLKQEKKF